MYSSVSTLSDRIRALTPRQAEAVAYTWHGYSNAEIARAMGCAGETVHRHLGAAYVTLGVDTGRGSTTTPRVLAAVALYRALMQATQEADRRRSWRR